MAKRIPLQFPLVLAVVILAIAFSLHYVLHTQDRARLRRTIGLQAEKMEQVALVKVPTAAPYIGDMVGEWLREGKPQEANWKATVARHLRRRQACLALAW